MLVVDEADCVRHYVPVREGGAGARGERRGLIGLPVCETQICTLSDLIISMMRLQVSMRSWNYNYKLFRS